MLERLSRGPAFAVGGIFRERGRRIGGRQALSASILSRLAAMQLAELVDMPGKHGPRKAVVLSPLGEEFHRQLSKPRQP